ncbi:MAG: PEP-CTERM sorting domain-containing protein [Telluria sp.]
MNFSKALITAALVAASTVAIAEPQNLVKNPGFEDGQQDWALRGFQGISSGPQMTRMLTLCVGAHCVDTPGSGAFLGQEITTTPGQLYDLSFWTGTGTGPGEFSVYWNGLLVDDQPLATSTVLQHSYSSLLATSDMAYLEIHGRDDAAHMWVDDVSVVPHMVNAVPEPQTYAMLLSGLLFAGLAIRRGP